MEEATASESRLGNSAPGFAQNRHEAKSIPTGSSADLSSLIRIREPVERKFLIRQNLTQLTSDELRATYLRYSKAPRNESKTELIHAVWFRLGELDGRAATELLIELPEEERESLLLELLSGWAIADRADAWDWLIENEDYDREKISQSRVRFGSVLGRIIADGDHSLAADYVQRLEEGMLRSNLSRDVIVDWVKTDSNAAMNWISSLPEGITRLRAWRTFVDPWVSESPVEAMDFIMNMETEDKWHVLETAIPKWAAKSGPSAAAEWLNQHPRGRRTRA